MRSVVAATLSLVTALLFASPARAEHSQSGDFYPSLEGKRWSETVTENYCLDGFEGPLTSGEYTNMKNSTVEQINNEVESETGIGTNWQLFSQVECNGYADFHEYSCSDLRIFLPNIMSRVSYVDLPAGDYGTTMTCDLDLDANNRIDFFWIAINDSECEGCTLDIHWNVFSLVPEGEFDYAGIFTHEMVHATGFGGHFSSSSDACTQSVGGFNVMCTGITLGVKNAGNSNGTWWRTLEGHDIGAINEVY